jgi:hypothetical protein
MRDRAASDVARQPPRVEIIEQTQHRRQRSFPKRQITGTAVTFASWAPEVNAPKIWHTDDASV